MMKFFRATGLLIVFAATLLLAGCFGGPDREVRFYTLPVPEVKNVSEKPLYDYTVVVNHASVDPAYRRNNIVYRESPYDFMFYSYSVWAARPEFLVEQVVTAMTKSVSLFRMVDSYDAVKPVMELVTHVIAIEEVDQGEKRFARLALNFSLRKTDAEEYIWRKEYDESKQYDGSDMRNFAEAVSSLLRNYVADALEDMKRTLSALPTEKIVSDNVEPQLEDAAETFLPPEPETAPAAE